MGRSWQFAPFGASRFLLPGTGDGRRQAVVVFHDVTDDRRHRDELTSFVAVVAHDLLNPLATVEGSAEAPQEELTEDGVRRIARAAVRMRTLIDGLLTALSPARVYLSALVQGITTARIDPAHSGAGLVPRFTHAAIFDNFHRAHPEPAYRGERPGPGHMQTHCGTPRRHDHGKGQRLGWGLHDVHPARDDRARGPSCG
jgi:hypothetical protein